MTNLAANIKNMRKLGCCSLVLFALVPRYTTHVIKVQIGPHVGEVSEPIGHGEESGNGGDVPGVLTVEAVFLQTLEMLLRDGVTATHGHRKVQHGELSRRQVCVVVIHDHLGATRGRSHDLQFNIKSLIAKRKTPQGKITNIRYLIGQSGFLGVDPVQRAVGHHTVETLVVDTGGHHNQLTVCLCKAACKYTVNPEIRESLLMMVKLSKKGNVPVT